MVGPVKTRTLQVTLEIRHPIHTQVGFAGLRPLTYGPYVSKLTEPEQLVEQPVPAMSLPSSAGGVFDLRSRVGVGPLVLFFYVHNGTPG